MANAKLFLLKGPETARDLAGLRDCADICSYDVDGKPLEQVYRFVFRRSSRLRARYRHVVLYGRQVPAGLYLGFKVARRPPSLAAIRANFSLRTTGGGSVYDVYRWLTRHARPLSVSPATVWRMLYGDRPLAAARLWGGKALGELGPGDRDHRLIRAADLRFPLLVARRPGRGFRSLDGLHRLVKSLWAGAARVRVVVVPAKTLARCRIARDAREFRQYIARVGGR